MILTRTLPIITLGLLIVAIIFLLLTDSWPWVLKWFDEDKLLTILAFAKFGGVFLTAAFGLIGLLYDYKKKDTDEITSAGRIALIGTVFSFCLAALGQFAENSLDRSKRQKETAAATQQRTDVENLLREIRRGVYPVRDMKVGLILEIDVARIGDLRYTERLDNLYKNILSVCPEIEKRECDINLFDRYHINSYGFRDGTFDAVLEQQNLPTKKEPTALVALHFFDIHVRAHPEAKKEGGIYAWGESSMGGSGISPGHHFVRYDFTKHVAIINAPNIRVHDVTRDGSLVGLPDLIGGEVEIALAPATIVLGANVDATNLTRAITLRELDIEFEGYSPFHFCRFASFKNEDGWLVYTVKLPETLDGVLQLKGVKHWGACETEEPD
jgi:hypothetical protein